MKHPRKHRARQLVAEKISIYRLARSNNDREAAWAALEHAHIVSQPCLALHLANHWTMLGFAACQRDWREAVGQIIRLALVPLGTLSGRIPDRNTERTTISPFKPMLIPAEFAGRIDLQ